PFLFPFLDTSTFEFHTLSLHDALPILHVVLRWMISNLDITRERTHQLEGPVELINDRRRHDIGRAEAAVDYDIVGLASLFGLRRPRRAAACVTGREMRDERRASQRHRFSVAQHFVDR